MPNLERTLTHARIPTNMGEFQLYLYHASPDNKEHLAIVAGDVAGSENVLVRVHSECFTGDVLGSRRCDCGEQLELALQKIAEAGAGVVIYLRQEGRGIGLRDKLRAYNLQDEGYDTVEANLMLGHADDEREYSAAAEMLNQLKVGSIQLMTNNPAKIESLQTLGITINGRVPLHPRQITADNAYYLKTKVERMRHLLQLQELPYTNGHHDQTENPLLLLKRPLPANRPLVTLSYAQTLDGSIAAERGQPLAISSPESMQLTHEIRAASAAILVGIETVLADNPSLTVRLVEGANPRPVILDSQLRFPLTAKLLQRAAELLIFTTEEAPLQKQHALEAKGVTVVRLPADANGRVPLRPMLNHLRSLKLHTLMVEGGAQIIYAFLNERLVDNLIVTVSLQFVGGHAAVGGRLHDIPRIKESHQKRFGEDVVIWGVIQ